MKAIEQYFPVVLFINYAVQGGYYFWVSSVDEILKCNHSNESYYMISTLLSVVLFIMLYKVVQWTFESVNEIVSWL